MYDKEKSSKISHKLLIARLLNKPENDLNTSTYSLAQSQIRDDVSTYSVDPSVVERIFDILLYKLKKQGIYGILVFTEALRKFDVDLSNNITLEEFQSVLNELRLEFTPEDVKGMYRYLESTQREGMMDYTLLVKDLTTGIPANRRDIVRSTFDRLDYSESGSFDLKQLKAIFNPRNHFDVKNGRRHADEIMSDFFRCIDTWVRVQGGNSLVNPEQFLEFWEHISPSIEQDASFEALLRNCFRFNELPRKNKLEVPSYVKDPHQTPIYDKERFHPTDSIRYTIFPGSDHGASDAGIFSIFEHLREQIGKKGPKGFVMLYRSLKTNDFDHDGKISCKEFIKSLHEIRVELLDKETIVVFKVFDPQNTGFISVTDFMSSFIPELNPRRRELIEELLASLAGQTGKITYTTIKKVFNPRGHPDFISNIKPDYDIKEEFYFVINTFLNLTSGVNDFIERDTMLQFFELYSFAYRDDAYFENIIKGIFRLSKTSDPKRSYHPKDEADTKSVSSEQSSRPVSQQGRQLSAPFGTDGQAPAGYSPKRPVSNYHTQGNEMKEILGLVGQHSPQKNGFGKKATVQNVSGGEEVFRAPREEVPSPLGSPQAGRFAEDKYERVSRPDPRSQTTSETTCLWLRVRGASTRGDTRSTSAPARSTPSRVQRKRCFYSKLSVTENPKEPERLLRVRATVRAVGQPQEQGVHHQPAVDVPGAGWSQTQ